MKIKKKILATVAVAILCVSNTQLLVANAESYSEQLQYGNLYYSKADQNNDGIYDYIEITGCTESTASVIIPSEIDGLPVTSIGDWAFEACNNLKSVEISDTVKYIGIGTFFDCVNLENAVISENITKIKDSTFCNCESLESIVIPNSVISIEEFAFDCCYNLKNIIIPESVNNINDSAFCNCINLKNILIENPNCKIYDSKDTICNNEDDEISFIGTIYGYENSTTQEYTEKYDYNFSIILFGDANEDGELNVRDSSTIARFLADGRKEDLSILSDFNCDGKINVRDASLIARYLANKNS